MKICLFFSGQRGGGLIACANQNLKFLFVLPLTRRKPETRVKHLRSNETRHVLAFVLGPRHRVRRMSPRPENLYVSRLKTLEKVREDQ
jgi:hypothetical protein